MTYAFTQDVPIDAAFYKRITDGLGDSPPKGLIVHAAVERPEGGLRYIDIWESEKTATGSPKSACTRSSIRCWRRSSATTCRPSPSAIRCRSFTCGVADQAETS